MPVKYTPHELMIALKLAIGKEVPVEIAESPLYVDLTDMYEICCWYKDAIESFLEGTKNCDEVESFFIDLEVQILGHLKLHAKSLGENLPGLLEFLGRDEN